MQTYCRISNYPQAMTTKNYKSLMKSYWGGVVIFETSIPYLENSEYKVGRVTPSNFAALDTWLLE